jgi:hypothetical protein
MPYLPNWPRRLGRRSSGQGFGACMTKPIFSIACYAGGPAGQRGRPRAADPGDRLPRRCWLDRHELTRGRWYSGLAQADAPTGFLTVTDKAIGDRHDHLRRHQIPIRIVGQVIDADKQMAGIVGAGRAHHPSETSVERLDIHDVHGAAADTGIP